MSCQIALAGIGIVAPGLNGWEAICRAMEAAFRRGEFESGVVRGVRAVSEHLQRHYPAQGAAPNELPDRPVVL